MFLFSAAHKTKNRMGAGNVPCLNSYNCALIYVRQFRSLSLENTWKNELPEYQNRNN